MSRRRISHALYCVALKGLPAVYIPRCRLPACLTDRPTARLTGWAGGGNILEGKARSVDAAAHANTHHVHSLTVDEIEPSQSIKNKGRREDVLHRFRRLVALFTLRLTSIRGSEKTSI
jgi:hypothetical protein